VECEKDANGNYIEHTWEEMVGITDSIKNIPPVDIIDFTCKEDKVFNIDENHQLQFKGRQVAVGQPHHTYLVLFCNRHTGEPIKMPSKWKLIGEQSGEIQVFPIPAATARCVFCHPDLGRCTLAVLR
jgi:hypothetical protein